MPLDDRVPVAGALDRDVVDDDVPVDLVGARRQVDLEVRPAGEGDRAVEGVGGVAPAGRVGAEEQDVRGDEVDARRRDDLGVEQVDDRPRGGRPGRDGEPDLVPGPVGLAEQQALFVVEVVGTEGFRDDRRRGGRGGDARALGDPPVRVQQVRVRVVRERVLVVQPRVLRGQRHRLPVAAVDGDVQRRGDPAAVRRVRDAVADGDGVGRGGQRELDVLPRREFHGATAGRLGGQRVRRAVRADHGAVGAGVLRLLLGEADRGAAPGDQRGVERGARHHGPGGGGRRGDGDGDKSGDDRDERGSEGASRHRGTRFSRACGGRVGRTSTRPQDVAPILPELTPNLRCAVADLRNRTFTPARAWVSGTVGA